MRQTSCCRGRLDLCYDLSTGTNSDGRVRFMRFFALDALLRALRMRTLDFGSFSWRVICRLTNGKGGFQQDSGDPVGYAAHHAKNHGAIDSAVAIRCNTAINTLHMIRCERHLLWRFL